MKKILSSIFLFTSLISSGQAVSQSILGDWIEVRREQRSGYIYSIGGVLLEPSIELSFFNDSTATFFNPQTPEPKSNAQYLVVGDTLLGIVNQGYYTIFDIEKITKTEMIIIWRSRKQHRDDEMDQKQHYIRKSLFNKLTMAERDSLKSPTNKDKVYLSEILARRLARETSVEESKYLTFAEVMPSYPGGYQALEDFLNKNLKWPIEFDGEGSVFLTFIVEKTGEISNINVYKSLGKYCDAEAIRLIKLMPYWIPGRQNGEKVRVKTTLPIRFKLDH